MTCHGDATDYTKQLNNDHCLLFEIWQNIVD